MATTITGDGDVTFLSFPIEKTETTADGDLIVYGKASDGSIDSDQQIVDPAWMCKAVKEWLDTGANLRVQHNPQRDPAGVGISAETDGNGATWVKGLIVEPIAKKLVAKGALRAYSVGIAHPTINRDMSAKGGRITDGELVEISLVDRPANKRCGIQLVKSVDGAPEYIGEVFGEDEDIAKALGADITKGVDQVKNGIRTADAMREDVHARGGAGGDTTFATMPQDMTFTFTPNDLANILKNKFIEQHYDELGKQALYDTETAVYKRDIDTATRRNLASQGHALPDGSYPIANADDLHNAATLARSGHGNVSGARALIERRAKELGVANPLSEGDANKVEETVPEVIKDGAKEADADVTKDPADGAKAKKPKGGKKMPPWLSKPDDDGDDDGDADDKKSAGADTEKCSPSGTPQSASGAKDAQPMKEIPNTGPPPESPMPAGRKTPDTKAEVPEIHSSPEVAALLRFKSIGMDSDLGRLHDLTCPAYSPDQVAKYHPYASFKSVIDEDLWRQKALEAAAGKSYQEAMEMQAIWQAVAILKNADEGELNDYRLEMHKAFRDANPGPTSYPSPGSMSPEKYHRPVITDGHAALSPGYSGPNSSPSVASGPVSGAGQFDKPPLSSGHQSPSPSHMKASWEYPKETGQPTHLTYARQERVEEKEALGRLHTHLMQVFPTSCPMDLNSRGPLDPAATPPTEGLSKAAEPTEPVIKAPLEDEFSEELLEKARKKMKKKLGKKVLSGSMTVDEARAKIGRNVSQKAKELSVKEQLAKGEITREEALKALGFHEEAAGWYDKGGTLPADPAVAKNATTADEQVEAGLDYIKKTYGSPDVIKSAVAEAVGPLMERLAAQQKVSDELKKTIDAIADAPDPRGEPFSGLAMSPIRKSARPAAVADTAEIAARTQQMMLRNLEHTANSSDNPAEREAAYMAINKMRGMTE